jgi:adenine-specific DNA-methyltransferase
MVVDLGAGMFDDVTMSTIILSMTAGQPTPSQEIEIRLGLTGPAIKNKQSDFLRPSFVISTASSEQRELLRKLDHDTDALGTLCDELIFGVVISGNKTELVSYTSRKGLKPFLEGRDIDRYLIRSTSKFLDYKPDEIHRPRSPRIFEATEKLLIQRITGGERPLKAAYDNKQFYTKESINNLLLSKNCPYDIKFILALLNSRLLSWYYRIAFTNGSTLTVNLSKEYLSQLPIPRLELSNSDHRKKHDRIADLARQMIENIDEETKANEKLDREIDRAVYQLYGLTELDILILEREVRIA